METKNNTSMREEHNRKVQSEIDFERKEVESLKTTKNKYIPEITKLETRLSEINTEVRRIDIDMDCRENKILVLSDKFWK